LFLQTVSSYPFLGMPPPENTAEVLLLYGFLLFPEKEAKSVVLLRRRLWAAQNSAKPTQGVWGRAPRKLYVRRFSSFPEKE
jgi:hypothetical protein